MISVSEGEGAVDRLGAAGNAAVRFDQMNGAAESVGIDLWKAIGAAFDKVHSRLTSSVIDLALDPSAAEGALTVKNNEGTIDARAIPFGHGLICTAQREICVTFRKFRNP